MSTLFPKWTNQLPTVLLASALGTLTLVVGGMWYYATPKFWRAGYMPSQPYLSPMAQTRILSAAQAASKAPEVPGRTYPGFSHQIHAGQKLGMDCRLLPQPDRELRGGEHSDGEHVHRPPRGRARERRPPTPRSRA